LLMNFNRLLEVKELLKKRRKLSVWWKCVCQD